MEVIESAEEIDNVDLGLWYSQAEEPATPIRQTLLDKLLTSAVFSHYWPPCDEKPKRIFVDKPVVEVSPTPPVFSSKTPFAVVKTEPKLPPISIAGTTSITTKSTETAIPNPANVAATTPVVDVAPVEDKNPQEKIVDNNNQSAPLFMDLDYDARLPLGISRLKMKPELESAYANLIASKNERVANQRLNQTIGSLNWLKQTPQRNLKERKQLLNPVCFTSDFILPNADLKTDCVKCNKLGTVDELGICCRCLYQNPDVRQSSISYSSPVNSSGPMPVVPELPRRRVSRFNMPHNAPPPSFFPSPISVDKQPKKSPQFWAGMRGNNKMKVSGANATPIGTSWMHSSLPALSDNWAVDGNNIPSVNGSKNENESQTAASNCFKGNNSSGENTPNKPKNRKSKSRFSNAAVESNNVQSNPFWAKLPEAKQARNTFVYGESVYANQMDSDRFTDDGNWSGFSGNTLKKDTNGFVEVMASVYGKKQIEPFRIGKKEKTMNQWPPSDLLTPVPVSSDDHTECEMEISDEEDSK